MTTNFIGELTKTEYYGFRYINEGTYGSLWKGKTTDNNTIVAIKFFCEEVDFKEELEAHKLLKERYNGTNIVKMIDYSEVKLAIVMNYISGSNLDNFSYLFSFELDSNNIKKFLSLFKQTLVILDKLDQSGLIHADIKPANIMVTMDYQVYLVDVGLLRTRRNRDERKYSRWWRSIGAMHGYATHEDDVFAALICFISLLLPKFYRIIQCKKNKIQYQTWLKYVNEDILENLTNHFKEREIGDDIVKKIIQDTHFNIESNSSKTLDIFSEKIWERCSKNVKKKLLQQLECFWNIAIRFMNPITAREILNTFGDSSKEIPKKESVDPSLVIIENDNILSDSNSPKKFYWKDLLKINKKFL